MACCWKISNSWIKLTSLIWISIKGVVRPMLDKKNSSAWSQEIYYASSEICLPLSHRSPLSLIWLIWTFCFKSNDVSDLRKNTKAWNRKINQNKINRFGAWFFSFILRKWYNNLIATSCPNSNQGTLPIIPRQQLKVWKIFFFCSWEK